MHKEKGHQLFQEVTMKNKVHKTMENNLGTCQKLQFLSLNKLKEVILIGIKQPQTLKITVLRRPLR